MPKLFEKHTIPAKNPRDQNTTAHHVGGTSQFIFAVSNVAVFIALVYMHASHCYHLGQKYGTNVPCAMRGTRSEQSNGDFLLMLMAFSGIFVMPLSTVGLKKPGYYLRKLGFISTDKTPNALTHDELEEPLVTALTFLN